ncbi:uncharacterized protein N7473_004839 [Penicillium subrubescens]|uniref:Uncharacterized protein n=1 Tax=Penicillium subrubescens TaxID=1316194 RepID=A0A1Q5T9C8_9EURO|nr:uncharacterized protein N7473_004839 [Penicillium subrubescens]KAJ5900769.1 hypothetical protein N7473_004839 [Penicillium subrubescens]OKO96842.1 hypothetical protein PENSUB_10396 [Penicillium subrubescens]
MTQYPAYTPTSLGKELGIMFAFIGACVVTMGVYSVIWRRIQLRTQEEDLARRKAFKNRTAAQPDTLSAANGLQYGGRNMSAAAAPRGERVYGKVVNGMGNGNGELL